MNTASISNTTPVVTLEDALLIAFLKLKGHTSIPRISQKESNEPRVVFDIYGDENTVKNDMQKYYNNESVGVLEFTRIYKETKSQLYNTKRTGRE